DFAGERLARLVCADRDLLDDDALSAIASALAEAQLARIEDAIRRVLARHPSIHRAVVGGLGAFLGEAAARAPGLDGAPLAAIFGDAAARCAPAAAVAWLLESALNGHHEQEQHPSFVLGRAGEHEGRPLSGPIDTVVKIGGVLLHRDHFEAAIAA